MAEHAAFGSEWDTLYIPQSRHKNVSKLKVILFKKNGPTLRIQYNVKTLRVILRAVFFHLTKVFTCTAREMVWQRNYDKWFLFVCVLKEITPGVCVLRGDL